MTTPLLCAERVRAAFALLARKAGAIRAARLLDEHAPDERRFRFV